jgi:ribosomal protein S20
MEKSVPTSGRGTARAPALAPTAIATATALLLLAHERDVGPTEAYRSTTRTRTVRAKYTCNPLPDEAVVRLIAIVNTTQLSPAGPIPWTIIQREYFPTYTRHALRGMYRRSMARIEKHPSSWISKQTSLLLQQLQSVGSTASSTTNKNVFEKVEARAKKSRTQRSIHHRNHQ